MSRHNHERKKNRQRATVHTPTGINRPNPGPAPTYRDDNPTPHTGEHDGKATSGLYRTVNGEFVTRFGDAPPGSGWVKRKQAAQEGAEGQPVPDRPAAGGVADRDAT